MFHAEQFASLNIVDATGVVHQELGVPKLMPTNIIEKDESFAEPMDEAPTVTLEMESASNGLKRAETLLGHFVLKGGCFEALTKTHVLKEFRCTLPRRMLSF